MVAALNTLSRRRRKHRRFPRKERNRFVSCAYLQHFFFIVAIMSGTSFYLFLFLQLIGDGAVAGCVEAKEEESVRQELVCYYGNGKWENTIKF